MIWGSFSTVTYRLPGGRPMTHRVRASAALVIALCLFASSCGLGHSPDLPIVGSATTGRSGDGETGSDQSPGASPGASGGGVTTAFEDNTKANGATGMCPEGGAGGEDGSEAPDDDCEVPK